MKTKTDKRLSIRRKRKYKGVKHGIGAWSPNFLHCEKKKNKNKKKLLKNKKDRS